MTKNTNLREVVLDLETTGFDFKGKDRIIEIGVVELQNHDPTGGEFRRIVNPGNVRISRRITELTGITDKDVEDKKKFKHPSVMEKLLEFIGEAKIVAHNAQFDRNFLNAALRRAGHKDIPKERWIDTVSLAKRKLKLKKNTLDALCDHFGISRKSREKHHGALIDARLTAEVYKRLADPLLASKDHRKKKPKVVINPRLDFSTQSTEDPRNLSVDGRGMIRDIEKHLQDSTGHITKLDKLIPNPHSASSHYFPLAVFATAIFRIAELQINLEPLDEEKVLSLLDQDTQTLHRLIDLAGTDIKSYFNEIHKFHVEYNSRGLDPDHFYTPNRKFEPRLYERSRFSFLEQKSLEIMVKKYVREEMEQEIEEIDDDDDIEEIDGTDDEKEIENIPESASIPNYYNFKKFAGMKSSHGIRTYDRPKVDEIHQDIVNHLYLATGHRCGLDWLLPEPHSASSPFFPIAALATAVLKIARVRIIMGLDYARAIECQLEEDRNKICYLIDLAGTDILSYYKEMHEFHLEHNERGYPELNERWGLLL